MQQTDSRWPVNHELKRPRRCDRCGNVWLERASKPIFDGLRIIGVRLLPPYTWCCCSRSRCVIGGEDYERAIRARAREARRWALEQQ